MGDDDPAARLKRRRFSAEYKLGILDEYDRLTDAGAKGALLRREAIGTVVGAILVQNSVAGWITGLAVASVSVVLAGVLWRSKSL